LGLNGCGVKRMCVFQQKIGHISETVRDRAKVPLRWAGTLACWKGLRPCLVVVLPGRVELNPAHGLWRSGHKVGCGCGVEGGWLLVVGSLGLPCAPGENAAARGVASHIWPSPYPYLTQWRRVRKTFFVFTARHCLRRRPPQTQALMAAITWCSQPSRAEARISRIPCSGLKAFTHSLPRLQCWVSIYRHIILWNMLILIRTLTLTLTLTPNLTLIYS